MMEIQGIDRPQQVARGRETGPIMPAGPANPSAVPAEIARRVDPAVRKPAVRLDPGPEIAQEDPRPNEDAARALFQARTQGAEAGDPPSVALRLDSLTEAEQALIAKLVARDREVRAHEQAHATVGGPYAGEPEYVFETGPDARRYAVGGEVAIDVAPVPDDPEATVRKMEIVKAAALAPAEPSAQDRRIAALADAIARSAEAELGAAKAAELQGVERDRPADLYQAIRASDEPEVGIRV
ncbi:MAG: putative metalloprotease CJM1_0395 family protein [Pseudomonadota bacterium]